MEKLSDMPGEFWAQAEKVMGPLLKEMDFALGKGIREGSVPVSVFPGDLQTRWTELVALATKSTPYNPHIRYVIGSSVKFKYYPFPKLQSDPRPHKWVPVVGTITKVMLGRAPRSRPLFTVEFLDDPISHDRGTINVDEEDLIET